MATAINRAPITFFTSLFLCVLVFGSRGLRESVPGMFIFGDSLVDVGNNNYLSQSSARADFPHYGIDFPAGKATGRFSNGKNAADFLAEKVGLPSPPPILSIMMPESKEMRSNSSVPVTGVSFASGGATIYHELLARISRNQSIHLTEQVSYYSLVYDQLVQQLGSDEAQAHLSKSIFLVVIGSNDLFLYFNKNSKVSKVTGPRFYVKFMVTTLEGLLKKLYELGARKFVVSGVGAIGCCPVQRKENTNSECNDDANSSAVKFNDGVKGLLQELKTRSSDIHYTYFDTYNVMDNIIQHPETYEINEVKEACCGGGNLKADTPCNPNSTYCSNRGNHLFWDLVHPTEYTSSLFASLIYNGSQPITTPVNVEQLVNV